MIRPNQVVREGAQTKLKEESANLIHAQAKWQPTGWGAAGLWSSEPNINEKMEVNKKMTKDCGRNRKSKLRHSGENSSLR